MKKNTSLIILLFVSLFLNSCKKDFFDVNESANNPTDVPVKLLLPAALIGVGFTNGEDMSRAGETLIQHNVGIGTQVGRYDVFDLGLLSDGIWSPLWNNITNANAILDKTDITREKTTENSPKYSGIAKLIIALDYSYLTDMWGDIPYTQGGKGLEFPQPTLDKQEDIYQGNDGLKIESLFSLIDKGIADLKTGGGVFSPGTDDIVYKGDAEKWIRMGYSLKLKLANTISVVNPALAKTMTENVISSNTYINASNLDFEVPFGSGTGNQNPLYTFNYVNRQGDQLLSSRFVAFMYARNDTVRLAKLYTKPKGVFVSRTNGGNESIATQPSGVLTVVTNARSQYNTYFIGALGEAPIRILTSFQANFDLAEAVVRLGVTVPGKTANGLFQDGIKTHMTKIGMTTTEINTYFTDNPTIVTLSGGNENQIKQIAEQKYIAWTGNGAESFNNYRRTGYPELQLPLNTGGDNPNVIPKRFPYGNNEISRNPNIPNPRPQTDAKIWWGK
ncbi:MAG TPA: SusD/RagB family nutrient-binding outer membrane lipoprotein [Flavitalea sp.]|nr:SusD/RagB family nutrient-binding outer membrane lipoprotein [Flavitalea sp.]